jgi:ferredoxin
VTVDHDKCTGIGICESLQPERFEIRDDGSLDLLRTDVAPDEVAQLEEIVRACPTAALQLVTEL